MKVLSKVIVTILVLAIAYSCAKKSNASLPVAPLPTNSNTNFMVDGNQANSPNSDGTANTSTATYTIFAIDNIGYPQIKITFHGAVTPAAATYSIISGTVSGGATCNFVLTVAGNYTAAASTGTLAIASIATHSYTATFNNITCSGVSAGTHSVTGTIGY